MSLDTAKGKARKVHTWILLIAMVLLGTWSGWSQTGAAKSGLLYVLDTQKLGPTSSIFLVDPAQGTVVRTIAAGTSPDMILAPDGSALYVTSQYWVAGNVENRLEIYDSSGNRVASMPNPDVVNSTMPTYPTRMAMAPSGKWIYMLKGRWPGYLEYYLAAFNTTTRQFLPAHALLPNCPGTLILPSAEDLKVTVVCNNSSVVRDITFGDSDATTKTRAIPATHDRTTKSRQWQLAFLDPSQRIGLFAANGAHLVVDRQQGKVNAAPPATDVKRYLGMQKGLLAKDNSSVFFGDQVTPGDTYSSAYDEVAALDPATLAVKASIPTNVRFYKLAMSGDGNTLYAVSPDSSAVTVVDVSAGKVVRQLHVGQTPIMAFAVP
jgi:hypothetical protein